MATDSERCVDDLLKRLNDIDNLVSELESPQSNVGSVSRAKESLESMQSFINNNRALIPSYCMKKAVDSLKRLELYVSHPQKSTLQFKFKPCNANNSPAESMSEKQAEKVEKTTVQNTNPTVGFNGKSKESLTLNPCEVDSKDISLANLLDCSVVVRGLANTVYINDLQNTSVSVGIACRAITVKNCTNCEFKLVCQQLRIDSTKDSKFEIFTSARSMLESSNGLEFKRLNLDNELKDLMVEAKFDIDRNNWKCIDDFDWLSPDVPSKHYKLVDAG